MRLIAAMNMLSVTCCSDKSSWLIPSHLPYWWKIHTLKKIN